MKNLSIQAKLLLLVGSAVLGLLVFGVVSFITLNHVKVNGPLYELMAMDKDVVADYVPPSQSLLTALAYCVKIEDRPIRPPANTILSCSGGSRRISTRGTPTGCVACQRGNSSN